MKAPIQALTVFLLKAENPTIAARFVLRIYLRRFSVDRVAVLVVVMQAVKIFDRAELMRRGHQFARPRPRGPDGRLVTAAPLPEGFVKVYWHATTGWAGRDIIRNSSNTMSTQAPHSSSCQQLRCWRLPRRQYANIIRNTPDDTRTSEREGRGG